MSTRIVHLALLFSLWVLPASAFPPAPYYQIFGTVRNDRGDPLGPVEGTVILSGVYSAFGSAMVSNGSIVGVMMANGGSGFTSPPTVTFSGGSGIGATGTAILTNGVVTGITVTNPGSGYTAPAIVGITGGGAQALEIVRVSSGAAIGPGINYSLSVPQDSGTTAQLYQITAMRPLLPFTIRVTINGINYVPMQIAAATSPLWTAKINSDNFPGISTQGNHWAVGLPAGKLRLDLWLGEDINNDGLPDDWQWDVVNSDSTGQYTDFTQIAPDAFGRNGMTFLQNYMLGTYPLEELEGLHFNIDSVTNGVAKLHFQAISGRTYHISSSTDLKNWTPNYPFSLNTDGTNTGLFYQADDSKLQNIYVKDVIATKRFFKLYVE